jgi:hypothetical protein
VTALRGIRLWNRAVVLSAATVVLVALATAIGWLVSRHHRTTTYSYSGRLTHVDLQLSSGPVVIVGSNSPAIEVRRTDDYAFGHDATERRPLAGGVLHIRSSCPRIVVGSCSASYELAVPETVAVNVRTGSGNVRLDGFRGAASIETSSGDVDVAGFCGFNLAARSGSGSVRVGTACAPRTLVLRSGSGDVVAHVLPGRYRIGIGSGSGQERVTGVRRDAAAPYTIDAHSGSGSVSVVGGL